MFCLTTVIHAEPSVGAAKQVLKRRDVAYEVVAFSRLFFHYKPPMDVELPDGNILKGAKTPMPIPADIKLLDGKKVSIKGYVIPLELDGNTVKTFLFADELVSCLFCQMLGFDQWVLATSNDPKGFTLKDEQFEEPVTIYGTFEVKEEYTEGRLTSLFRIKVDGLESVRHKLFGII